MMSPTPQMTPEVTTFNPAHVPMENSSVLGGGGGVEWQTREAWIK